MTIPLLPSSPHGLTPENQHCIQRLLQYFPSSSQRSGTLPINRLAAVLVLLYQHPSTSELYVLLTTRSKHLRTHAGQTACPGGRLDESDEGDHVRAAFREANEEIALPLPGCVKEKGKGTEESIHVLCTLDPFLSLHGLLVTPVIALLSDISVLQHLKASEEEVSRIFSHPLRAVLDPVTYFASGIGSKMLLAERGSEDWIYDPEYHHTSDTPHGSLHLYRNHRFRSVASPIKGLTSDILIKTAEIAYTQETAFERYAPEQVWKVEELVDLAIECANHSSTARK
ncbi:hypothetical protein VNI00_002799 [Paramarasmius palmivorus]|uniref:Nudix hydrolase domain-containing protein n=1 Tax=Paramarasmius palmivorus TaxID=297713 RepID=A0AAW0DYF2_9AGAR